MYLQSVSKDPQRRPGSSSTGHIQLRCVFIGQISNLSKTGQVNTVRVRNILFFHNQAKMYFYGPNFIVKSADKHSHTDLTGQDRR